MAAFDPTAFRLLFPSFADDTAWPDPLLQAYWDIGREYIGVPDSQCYALNGAKLQFALDCMCAHLATVMAVADTEGSPDGGGGSGVVNGGGAGILLSASIGAVSVSNMPPPVKGMWDYWLAQTPYGQQLLAMLQLLLVGGIYIGGLPERKGFRKVGGVFW